MNQLHNILLEGKHGRPILTDVFYRQTGAAKPVVIFSHGFKGFKDWGGWKDVARRFADAGLPTVNDLVVSACAAIINGAKCVPRVRFCT